MFELLKSSYFGGILNFSTRYLTQYLLIYLSRYHNQKTAKWLFWSSRQALGAPSSLVN